MNTDNLQLSTKARRMIDAGASLMELSDLKALAKKRGFKVKVSSNSLGRFVDILDSKGTGAGKVRFESPEQEYVDLLKFLEFKVIIDRDESLITSWTTSIGRDVRAGLNTQIKASAKARLELADNNRHTLTRWC